MATDAQAARAEAATDADAPTGAAVIAARLHRAGCRFAFGIPGGEVLSLVDALGQAGIRFVLTKHENSAGFMGEGVHHMDGAPVVLVATVGPGVANATNVIANAHQDRVPMIVLTGRVDPADALTYTHQVFDHAALLRPITKASLTAVDGAVDVVIDKAVAIALDGQPGPVHVDVPIGVAAGRQTPAAAAWADRPAPAPAAPADGPDLQAARALFAAARNPVMVVGVDVLNQGNAPAVRDFAQRFGVPVITTYKAKGVVPEDAPLAIGGAGLSPKADAVLLPLFAHSDCIVLAGYDPIEMRVGWRHPWPAEAPVIEFSAVPNTHFMHRARHSFIGDVGAGLQALGAGLSARPTWPDGQAAATREALRRRFAPSDGWGPARAFATARAALPPETVVTADSGAHRILLSQVWTCPGPRRLLQSSGLCTMGCAVPLAMGAKLAAPDRPVVAFVGDAGLEMVLGELATLRDLTLPVVIVVMVDRSLALIEMKQRRIGLQNRGVDFDATDFPAVATALGGEGVAVATADELTAALRVALHRDKFTLISCVIGRRAYDGTF